MIYNKWAVMFGRIWGKKALFEIKSGIMTVNDEWTTLSLLIFSSMLCCLPSSGMCAQLSRILILWVHTWEACSHCLSADVTSAILVVIHAIDKQGYWRTSLHFFSILHHLDNLKYPLTAQSFHYFLTLKLEICFRGLRTLHLGLTLS